MATIMFKKGCKCEECGEYMEIKTPINLQKMLDVMEAFDKLHEIKCRGGKSKGTA